MTTAGAASSVPSVHKWKFDPTINAPWALEDDQQALDTPTAAGLCRSNPFDTTGAYGALGTNVVAIVGDGVVNTGFSNLGCTSPQNETTIAVNPMNSQNLIAGANDYRVCCDFTGLSEPQWRLPSANMKPSKISRMATSLMRPTASTVDEIRTSK